MKTRSWTSDSSIVLEIDRPEPSSYARRDRFVVRIVRMPPADFREMILSSRGWKFAMEPGFGSFAHDAAKLVDARAESEEEAVLLASVEGYAPDFAVETRGGRLVSIKDARTGSVLWDERSDETLNS